MFGAYTRAKKYLRVYKGNRERALDERSVYKPSEDENVIYTEREPGLRRYFLSALASAGGYGIKAGKHSLQDYGSRVDLNFNIAFIKNLTWRVESYFYTTYSRAEAQILNKFDFRFNKYLATHLEFYSRFDDSRERDDHHGYWMFRDYLSFGLSMNF